MVGSISNIDCIIKIFINNIPSCTVLDVVEGS